MKIIAIIQARMTSRRLPGKALINVHGKPLLSFLIERVKNCTLIDDAILATSSHPSDDPLEIFAKNQSIAVYRGSLENVAERLCNAARSNQADGLVRICGDSPLIDPNLIDQLVYLFRSSPGVDLVTNVQTRTFPKGQSIEVISVSALESKVSAGLTEEEKEHATLSFYKSSDQSNKLSVTRSPDISSVQLSVDNKRDLKIFEAITRFLGEPYEHHDLSALSNAYHVCKKLERN
jgi:spore coat polysaccharide biosynthesis protein SpsF (cytidylyltransferase family)